MSEERREMFRLLASHGHVGLTFAFSIMIGFGMGWYLDEKVFDGRTSPWLTFIFLGLGIAAGFRTLWRVVRDLQDEK